MNLSLLVIKTLNPEALKTQYEALGFVFEYHNHGNGPWHYTTKIEETIFEIYPLPKSKTEADNTTRLGFFVNNLNTLIPKLTEQKWIISSQPKETDWGFSAVVQDFDGRKVELTEK